MFKKPQQTKSEPQDTPAAVAIPKPTSLRPAEQDAPEVLAFSVSKRNMGYIVHAWSIKNGKALHIDESVEDVRDIAAAKMINASFGRLDK